MDSLRNNGTGLKINRGRMSDIQKTWRSILEHKFVFLGSIILCLAGVFAINKYTTPVYIVTSTISINPVTITASPRMLLNTNSEESGEEIMGVDKTREIATLTSVPFIQKTIESLNFTVSYFKKNTISEGELYKNAPFVVSFPDTAAMNKILGSSFKVIFKDKESFVVIADGKEDSDSKELPRYKVDQTVSMNGCPFILKTTQYFNAGTDLNNEYRIQLNDPISLAFEFREGLEITTESPESTILTINLKSSTPEKGVDFLNEFTKQYIKDKYEEKSRSATQALAFINEQINTVKSTLGGTESSLANFKASNTYSDPTAMTDRNLDALATVENERFVLRQQENYYSSLLSDLSSGTGLDQLVAPSSVGIQDEATNALVRQLSELQIEKNSYAASGNSKNPYIQELDNKINNTKSALRESVRKLSNTNRDRIGQLNARAGQFQANVYRIPLAERQFTDIKRTTDFNDNLYQFLMQKRVEAGIMKASATVEDKIIEPAFYNSTPLEPKPTRNYIFGFVVGLLLPFGYIKMKSALSKKIDQKDEVLSSTNIPIVGNIYRNQNISPIVIDSTARTAVSESFRILRSNIITLMKGASKKVILLTSTESGEGKSFISINTAFSFAVAKKKTVLVNLDLRVPSTTYEIIGNNEFGISSYLNGKTSFKDIIQTTESPYLDYISTGELPINPAELLMEGSKLDALFSFLRETYDYVILDTPPIGVVADPLIISNYSDLNILVVREKYTLKESLFELEEMRREGKIKDVVIVVNDVRLEKKGYKNAYYYKK